jgi:Na+/H+ antiporter NhaD/arsenite permease-like protein
MSESSDIVELSPKKFLFGCFIVSVILYFIGRAHPFSPGVVAAEVMLTILALFVLGSIRYRLDKNALTYGAGLIIIATFWQRWWSGALLREQMQNEGTTALVEFVHHHFLTLHGLEEAIHADTMLFILGLTFFVSVIAQTRILESVSFAVLRRNKGAVVPTIAVLTAIVAFSSGILDGVSMIGLLIRTMVIILILSKADDDAVIYAVIVSTLITTVCGMWLAYGEPPNLIMKTNLHPYLDNSFFIRYCAPAAVASYLVVLINVRKRLKGRQVDIKKLDIIDLNLADVRFLQASKHGHVPSAIEFLDSIQEKVGAHYEGVRNRLHKGEQIGKALVEEGVSKKESAEILGDYFTDNLADALYDHYSHLAKGGHETHATTEKIAHALADARKARLHAQLVGAFSFIPFIGLLIGHAINHSISLFWASFSGFVVAMIGIYGIPKMRKLALHEAVHEYKEYLFLFPLFLSITLLQKTGFFNQLSDLLHVGIEKLGVASVAYAQYAGACVLSALLDNNVVADFASRALHGLDIAVLHLFAMAQIAGYAVGGCWTHVGSAQSVVAYSFIQKEVNDRYTPMQWIKAMTGVILQICVVMSVLIVIEGALLRYLH